MSAESIPEGWVYISSKEEERAKRMNEEKRAADKDEMVAVQRSGFLAHKKSLRAKVNLIPIPVKVILSRLDGSLRKCILRDALNSCREEWKRDITLLIIKARVVAEIKGSRLEEGPIWERSYKGEKSLLEDMASFAFSSTHPAENQGLTRSILVDILWMVEVCLGKNVSLILGRSLTVPEHAQIETSVIQLADPLLFLWEKTSGDAKDIKSRLGLPEKWRKEKEARKAEGARNADEGYSTPGRDKLKNFLREGIIPRGFLIPQDDFSARKEFLARSLKFGPFKQDDEGTLHTSQDPGGNTLTEHE